MADSEAGDRPSATEQAETAKSAAAAARLRKARAAAGCPAADIPVLLNRLSRIRPRTLAAMPRCLSPCRKGASLGHHG